MRKYFDWQDLIDESSGRIKSKDVSSFGAVLHSIGVWMSKNNRDEIEFDDAFVVKLLKREDRQNA